MKNAVVVILALVLGAPAHGQFKRWSFEGRGYYNPLIAGVREPVIGAMAVGWGDRVQFQLSQDEPRFIWDVDVGAELPLVGWQQGSNTGRDAFVAEGKTGFGLWATIDFHTLVDHVDRSGPIVNTDYRFGGAIKVQRGLPNDRWIAARVAFGHESTHLGDEFALAGSRRYRDTFERINVDWEYLDVGALYESHGDGPDWSVRGGVITTIPFGDSYYLTDANSATESRVGPVTPSTNWVDPYAGFEIEEDLWNRWDGYVSTELRWRSIYDYHKVPADAAEDRQASVNIVAGIRKRGATGDMGRASPFVRFYRGVNPHGQFRNQKDYMEYGVGVRLVR